jgi:putative membrane-bound dehydrogenase-like protein
MTLPEGFRATLFAAEPDVVQPVAFTIDPRGRLWVAQAMTYPIRQPEGQGKDSIIILDDTDGDGAFDKRTLFAEGLNLVSGIEVGFGGVFVGAAPYLLFIPDRNGDDKPDGAPRCSSTAGATRTPTRRSTASSGAPTAGSTAARACSPTPRSAGPVRPPTSA